MVASDSAGCVCGGGRCLSPFTVEINMHRELYQAFRNEQGEVSLNEILDYIGQAGRVI